jgi:ribosomal protein S18 acetylase RimI-like enzyme
MALPAMSLPALSERDLAVATAIMTTAFAQDPVWGGWAFPLPDAAARDAARAAYWRFILKSGMRYPWLRLSSGDEAAALWIPPGGEELTSDEVERLEPLLRELVGEHAASFLKGLALFEAAHPHDEPHYYLSLLGTHDAHRGRGIGMRLLEENLGLIDRERMPCYLESTNAANLRRYESVGFVKTGEFALPGGGPTVDTLWRPART